MLQQQPLVGRILIQSVPFYLLILAVRKKINYNILWPRLRGFTVAMLEFGKMILHFQTQSLLTPLLNYMPVFRLFFFTIDLTCNCVLIVSKIRCIRFKILTRFSTLAQLFKNNQRTRSYNAQNMQSR